MLAAAATAPGRAAGPAEASPRGRSQSVLFHVFSLGSPGPRGDSSPPAPRGARAPAAPGGPTPRGDLRRAWRGSRSSPRPFSVTEISDFRIPPPLPPSRPAGSPRSCWDWPARPSGRRSPWVRRWECEAEDRWRRRAYGLGASAEERAGHLRAKVGLRGLLQSLARRGRLGGRLAPSGGHSRAPGLSPPMGIPAWRQGARELPAGTAEERDEEPIPPES